MDDILTQKNCQTEKMDFYRISFEADGSSFLDL
jgi:hypothetical protein